MTALIDAPILTAQSNTYGPYGGAAKLWVCRDREILMDGPAGTGKTRAILEKIHYLCNRYAGIRALILRATRESMTESVLVTYEDEVLSWDEKSEIACGADRSNRQKYHYPNGSELVVAGLKSGGRDLKAKVMSTQYDVIGVFEGTEIKKDDHEKLLTRMRNFKMPYQQVIYDCNPQGPRHWLNLRPQNHDPNDPTKTLMTRILSRHEDNPVLYDHDTKQWTPRGEHYLATLNRLSGAQRLRLLFGRWVQADNVVFPDWDPAVHILDKPLMPIVRVIAAKDWGFTNPEVTQVWGLDSDGRMYCLAQTFHTGKPQDWWLAEDKRMFATLKYGTLACDPADPKSIANYQAHGLPAMAADNSVGVGLKMVADRLKKARDGMPRLFFIKDNQQYKDPYLVEEGIPASTEEEFDSYVRRESVEGKNTSEQPADYASHGMDAMRYAVVTAQAMGGGQPIKSRVYRRNFA